MNGHVCRLAISDLSHEDDVWGLTQHGADDAGEVETDRRLNFDLVDAGQVVFDRVFGRNDLAVGPIELAQGTVQSCSLSGACRTSHKEDAVRAADDVLERAVVLFAETEVTDTDLDVVAIEDTHDHCLTVAGGEQADPHVEIFTAHAGLDPAVLRLSFFGDINTGHDFDTRNERRVQPARRRIAFDQFAVDAVADADFVVKRLDVDVAGPHVDGFGDHQIDEFDDRGAVVVDNTGGRGQLGFGEVDGRFGEFGDHRIDRFGLALPVMAVNCLLDDLFGGHDLLDLFIDDEPQLVDDVESRRVVHGDRQGAILVEREGHDHVFAGDRLGNQLDDRGRNLQRRNIKKCDPELLGLRLADLRRIDVFKLQQGVFDFDSQLGSQGLAFGQLLFTDEFFIPFVGHLVLFQPLSRQNYER